MIENENAIGELSALPDITFEVIQPIHSIPQRYRQTDGHKDKQTTYESNSV